MRRRQTYFENAADRRFERLGMLEVLFTRRAQRRFDRWCHAR